MSKSNGEIASYSGTFDPKRALRFILVMVVVGLVIIFVQSLQLGVPSAAVNQVTIMLSVAGAAMSIGGLVGFLFGVPRRLQKEGLINPPKAEPDGEAAQRLLYEGNTNLEQISDWLTKLIVGVTLVEFTNIVDQLQKYSAGIATATGRGPDGVFAIGIMLFFFITGFLVGYLWSRLYLGRALTAAEYEEKLKGKIIDLEEAKNALERQADADSDAIAFVRRVLASDRIDPDDGEKARVLFKKASNETLSLVYYIAQTNRRDHWKTDKQAVEKSIPVFEGLIGLDGRPPDHRNFAQLAYCLKDKAQPDFVKAEELLSKAIKIRGAPDENGYRIYEANRAYVRIRLEELGQLPRAIAGNAEKEIKSDLDIGREDYMASFWLARDPTVQAWATAHQYKLGSQFSAPPPMEGE